VHFRFHEPHRRLAAPFGSDAFGQGAEWFARAFGTPYFLVVQTGLVIVWIAANAAALAHFDPYPFILLNLAFSTQAAYAAPLILLAATRQADRDHAMSDADARHREELRVRRSSCCRRTPCSRSRWRISRGASTTSRSRFTPTRCRARAEGERGVRAHGGLGAGRSRYASSTSWRSKLCTSRPSTSDG